MSAIREIFGNASASDQKLLGELTARGMLVSDRGLSDRAAARLAELLDALTSAHKELHDALHDQALLNRALKAERYIEVVEPEYNTLVVLIADLCSKDFLDPCVMCRDVCRDGMGLGHEEDCPLGQAVEFFRKMSKTKGDVQCGG